MNDDGGDGGKRGDQPKETELEQRVENLEEQNQQLAAQLARYLPDGPSRRDVLKYGATAFAAAGIGSAATGAALGDASTSDSDGDVGTPSSRVDVFADGVSSTTITAASSGTTKDVDAITATGPSKYDVTIFQDSNNNIIARDMDGNLVAGGSGNLNVTDGTDFAEVLAECVNNQNLPTVALANGAAGKLPCKSTQTLSTPPTLWGVGRNKISITPGVDLSGQDVFTINSGNIIRIDSIKFHDQGNVGAPARWIKGENPATEFIITHCEFREATEKGVDLQTPGGYNSIIDSWFLAGSGLRVDNANDIRLIGNRCAGDVEITNCSDVIRRANQFDGAYVDTGTSYNIPNESIAAQMPQDVTSSRTTGTTYQNDSPYVLFVNVQANVGSGASAGDIVQISPQVGANSTGKTTLPINQVQTSDGVNIGTSLQFIVPPNYYYQVNISTGTLAKWFEQTIGSA